MDKHTNRYMNERFTHYDEELSFGNIANYIKKADCSDDYAYLSSAISDLFEGEQRQYLQFRLWDKQTGRNN